MFSRKLVIVQKPSYFQKSVGWIRKLDLVFKNYSPASRGVAAHTAGLFRSVRGAKGGVEYEEYSLNVFPCFCNGFLQSTVLYTFVAIKPVENIMFDNASNWGFPS